MRPRFDDALTRMKTELTRMGALCEEAISLAGKALSEGSDMLANRVMPLCEQIDEMERNIENLCLKLILHEQPVARDLRQISAALKIVTDMERIGAQAADIAEIILVMLADGYVPDDVGHIHQMAAEAGEMVTKSVDAYVQQDTEDARNVIRNDDVVDAHFLQVREGLTEALLTDPGAAAHLLDLLMIDKYLERIADHAVSIAEWVIYSVTGIKEGDH